VKEKKEEKVRIKVYSPYQNPSASIAIPDKPSVYIQFPLMGNGLDPRKGYELKTFAYKFFFESIPLGSSVVIETDDGLRLKGHMLSSSKANRISHSKESEFHRMWDWIVSNFSIQILHTGNEKKVLIDVYPFTAQFGTSVAKFKPKTVLRRASNSSTTENICTTTKTMQNLT
jgi:hypothetical protein